MGGGGDHGLNQAAKRRARSEVWPQCGSPGRTSASELSEHDRSPKDIHGKNLEEALDQLGIILPRVSDPGIRVPEATHGS